MIGTASECLFLAVWPTSAERDATLSWQIGQRWPADAQLTEPDDLHMTLHVVGKVPPAALPDLLDGLDVRARPFELTLDQQIRGDNAVLTPSRLPDGLVDLHARLEIALRRLQLPPIPRRHPPHVTLARHVARLQGGPAPARPAPVKWHCNGFTLATIEHGRPRVLKHFEAPQAAIA